MKHLFFLFATLILFTSSSHSQNMPKEYEDVLKFLDKKGDYKDNVFKVNIPRADIDVTIDGIAMPTNFGFTGWIAMTPGVGGMNVMMGDLVLREEEVNPVMTALLDHDVEVTALHNHFFWDLPHIYYMHVHAHGTPADIAHNLKPALDLLGHIPSHASETIFHTSDAIREIHAVPGKLNTVQLNMIIGAQGETNNAVYKFTLGRNDLSLKMMGATINSRMGLNSWAAFVGSDDHAAVAGDIAMRESEVQNVLKALRKNNLSVVAIHHHMTDTSPVVIFLHYWGTGPAETLAHGFRAALDELGTNTNHKH